jgi:hypothetical protein
MPIKIVSAERDAQQSILIDLVAKHLNQQSDTRRFDWLYKDNPCGKPRAWLAVDEETDAIIGAGSAFIRSFFISKREVKAWVLGDFCIAEQHRSLGAALKLQRAFLEEVDAGVVAFCYDFPSHNMMAVYRRLGVTSSGQMIRFAKPLRVDRKIKQFVPGQLSRAISPAGNFLLSLRDRVAPCKRHLDVALHDGNCAIEFSEIAKALSRSYDICSNRSAEYLNWRYRQNPVHKYEIMTARCKGELLAYVIFHQDTEDATVADLFGVNDQEIICALLHTLALLLRTRHVTTVNLTLNEYHPLIPYILRAGFKPREKSPYIIYGSAFGRDRGQWFLTNGDRDS